MTSYFNKLYLNSSVKERGFIERVLTNSARYVSLFSQVIDVNMPTHSINFKDEDQTTQDVIMAQRKFNMNQAQLNKQTAMGIAGPANADLSS